MIVHDSTHHLFRAVAAALLAMSTLVGSIEAQESRPTPLHDADEVAEIRIDGEVVLGALDDPFDLSSLFVQVDRTSDGSWLVLSRTHERNRIAEYGPEGRFRGTIGGPGEGPGEFRLLRAFSVLPGDSILAVDFGGEFSVLSRDGQWVRGGRTGLDPLELVGLGDGRAVAAANAAAPGFAGFPLHLIDPASDSDFVVKSLGSLDGTIDPGALDLERQRVPVARALGSERILSVDRVHYLIEEWSLQGDLYRSWRKGGSWFESNSGITGRGAGIRGAAEYDEDRIWVVFSHMDPDERPEPETPVDQYFGLTDSVVELVDLNEGQVVARAHLPGWSPGFTATGELILSAQDELGMVRLRILELLPGDAIHRDSPPG